MGMGWLSGFTDGLCAGWGAAQIINAIAYSNPISGTVATVLNVGCGAWSLYQVFK